MFSIIIFLVGVIVGLLIAVEIVNYYKDKIND